MIKEIAMAQWVNRIRNNIFVNPLPLPLSCEISGALHLAQAALTAGRQAGSKQGTASLHHYGLTNAFQRVLSDTNLLQG